MAGEKHVVLAGCCTGSVCVYFILRSRGHHKVTRSYLMMLAE